MKRAIVICFFVVTMTMLFTGCKSSNINGNEVNKIEVSKSNEAIDIKVNEIERSKSSSEIEYKIFEKEYIAYNKENKQFKVKYAQISGLENESLERQINQILKLSMTEWINNDCEWAEKFQVDVKYKTSKYLSLCYTIKWKNSQVEDSMSTCTRIGVTIDMRTGERVYLDNLVKDTESLKQKLVHYSYGNEFSPSLDSKEADKIIHYTSISEKKYLDEIYKTDPLVYNYMLSYIRKKPSFYLTDNKLVVTRNEYDLNDIFIDFKQ